MTNLFDPRSAMYVLGSLMLDSTKVLEDRYNLTVGDFDIDLYKIIFGAIFNMANKGIADLEPHEIDMYLAEYPEQYSIFKNNKGNAFLENIMKIASGNREKFDFYYTRVKKFTILREMDFAGFDTSSVYNPNVAIGRLDVENRKLDALTERSLIDSFKKTINDIEVKNLTKEGNTPQFAGANIRENIKKWKVAPDIGEPLDGEILNYVVRGARLGTMMVLSSPTSHGKTRFMVSNACSLSLPRIDRKTKKVIHKGELQKTLYMGTEMLFEEIQRLIVAHVSGVSEERISLGITNDEEDLLIDQAADIIEYYQDNILIAPVSDMSVTELKSKLVQQILKNNYAYIFYDYLEAGVSLSTEFSKAGLRTDQALLMMATALKEIAVNYHVFVMTATQTNRECLRSSVRDARVIADASSITNKADAGFVGVNLKLHKEELECVREIMNLKGITEPADMPTVVFDVYKNRGGSITGIKIWRKFNYSTLECEDLFVTDQSYNLMDLGNYKLEYELHKVDVLDALTELKKERESNDN